MTEEVRFMEKKMTVDEVATMLEFSRAVSEATRQVSWLVARSDSKEERICDVGNLLNEKRAKFVLERLHKAWSSLDDVLYIIAQEIARDKASIETDKLDVQEEYETELLFRGEDVEF